jgi:transcription initiation factor TFIIE subunit alpha
VQELDSKGYVCPQCKKTFNTLEVDRLLDMTAMTFVCDVCRHELIDNEDADAVRGSRDRMERFNHQMRFILAGLRASEEMVMPRLDIAAYVKQHLVQAEADRQEKMGGPSGTGAAGSGGRGHGELRIAGQDGNSVKDEGVGIVISGGVDEDRVRAERNRAAEAKKVQNALPAWHLQSTISGDLTALGVAERARAEAAEAQRAAVASAGSDDALRGLGTINGRLSDTKMDSMISMPADVKPATSVGSYMRSLLPAFGTLMTCAVDDYYASLTNPASQPYTSGTSTNPEELGDDDEDIKPDITQLMHTSLNDYRKRARSPDDIEDATTPASKTARLDDPAASAELFESTDLSGDQPAEDDPTVYGKWPHTLCWYCDRQLIFARLTVNGEAMPYSVVTEEHHDLMTPEEYAAYFVIFDSRF